MAFYRGMFNKVEVSIHAMNHESMVLFPVRATLDIVGHLEGDGILLLFYMPCTVVFLFTSALDVE